METTAILVLVFAATTLGYQHAEIQQLQTETTTAVNDLDNSVYAENETPSPLPQFPEHMPTTGCFGHLPQEEVKYNNINTFPADHPGSDPIPPQFNNPMTSSYNPQPFANRNYYPGHPIMPFNPVAPAPLPFSPYQRFPFPNQENSARPIVIVKLLQPIILPVARPMFPEGGERNPDEVDSEKFTSFQRGHGFNRFGGRRFGAGKYGSEERPLSYRQNNFGSYKVAGEETERNSDEADSERFTSFQRGHGFNRFGGRRFGAEKYRSVERPLPYRQNTFGPYKVAGEENIHVTVKLH